MFCYRQWDTFLQRVFLPASGYDPTLAVSVAWANTCMFLKNGVSSLSKTRLYPMFAFGVRVVDEYLKSVFENCTSWCPFAAASIKYSKIKTYIRNKQFVKWRWRSTTNRSTTSDKSSGKHLFVYFLCFSVRYVCWDRPSYYDNMRVSK